MDQQIFLMCYYVPGMGYNDLMEMPSREREKFYELLGEQKKAELDAVKRKKY